MAGIFEYKFNVGGNFTAALDGMTESTGRFKAAVETSQQGLSKWEQKFAAFGLIGDYIDKFSNAVGGIVDAGANAELQLINMKTLFGGNAEAAKEMYDRISEYGKVTPYDKAGLIQAQSTMMSFGMEGERAFEVLRQIGDIAMGDSGKMQSLSLAFAQVSSAGKLSGQDLMQMINAGFNPLNEISKLTGKSMQELKEEMSRGAISTDMVAEAFRSATSEGGLFYGAIDEASQTAAGKMASIRDSIEEVKVSIFNASGGALMWVSALSEVMVPVSQLLPMFQALGGTLSWIKGLKLASMFSGFASTASTAFTTFRVVAVGACRTVGVAIMNIPIIGWIAAAVAGLIALGTYLWETSETFRGFLYGIWEVVKALVVPVWDFLVGRIKESWATLKTWAVLAWDMLRGAFERVRSLVAAVWEYVSSVPGRIRQAIGGVLDFLREKFRTAYDWLHSNVFRPIIGFFTDLYDKYVRPVLDKIVGLLGKVFNPIIELWNKLTGKVVATFKVGFDKGVEDFRKEEAEEATASGEGSSQASVINPPVPGSAQNVTGSTLSSVGSGAASGGGSVRSITVNVERLVERFEIHTTNLQGDLSRVKDMVSEALLSALNDVNLA